MAFSYNKKNLANTTITGAITPTQTSVTVADATVFSYAFFYATLMPSNEMSNASNSEIVLVTNIQGNTLTLVRGQENTIARSFPYGAVITNGIYTRDIDYARSIGRKVFMAEDDGTDDTNTSYQIVDPMIKNIPEEGSIITVEFGTPSYGAPTLGVNNGVGGLVQVSGSNIHITDSSGQIDSVEMYGDTQQTTYSGKNLFNVSSYDGITQNDDGTVKSTKYYTATTAVSLHLEPSTRYTISIRNSNGELNGQGWGVAVNGTWINTTSGTGAVTTDANGDVTLAVGASSYGAIGGYNAFFQLEKGSQATSYEPYVGTASPNPDYPQEVQTVTGEQTITVSNGTESQSYPINLGKNLYQSIGITTASGGLTSTVTEDGKLHITGTATRNSSNFAGTMTTNLPAGTYTFSLTKAMPFRILLRSNDNQNHWVIEAGQTKITQTITSPLTSLWVWGYQLVRDTTYDETVGFMLEKGSTATSFAPYFTPIELCKIGTYQDYIYKSGENWYVHKETGKLLADVESGYIGNGDGYTNISYFVFDMAPDAKYYNQYSNNLDYNCTHATPKVHASGSTWDTSAFIGGISMDAAATRYWIGFQKGTTLADMKSDLLGMLVYYPLATPTDTQITNATLISQLNALYNMLPEGVADVVVTGDLAGSLTIKYYQQGTGTYTAPIVGGAEIDGGDNEQVVELDSYLPYRLVYDTNGYWRVLNKGPKVTTGAIMDGAVTAAKITRDNINYGTTSSDTRIGTFLGRPLWRRVEKFTNIPTGYSVHYWAAGTISNLDSVVAVNGMWKASGAATYVPINSVPPDAVAAYGIGIRDFTASSWAVVLGTSMSTTNSGYIILDYTKTS